MDKVYSDPAGFGRIICVNLFLQFEGVEQEGGAGASFDVGESVSVTVAKLRNLADRLESRKALVQAVSDHMDGLKDKPGGK